jgi:hypothetical protein
VHAIHFLNWPEARVAPDNAAPYDFRIAAVRVGRETLTVKADIRDGPFKAIPNYRASQRTPLRVMFFH